MLTRLGLAICCLTPMFGPAAVAEDWPQWMGNDRDNVWSESGILQSFPPSGPTVLWRTPVAGGYAGPAVANGRVYLTDFVKSAARSGSPGRSPTAGTERVLCLDADTGELIWKHEYQVVYGISYPAGPRCTPNVDEGFVYTLGAEGHLLCLDADSGKVVWSRHLPRDYETKTAIWGYAGHPLIDGDKLICVAGGEGSHAVALDKRTGKELWRALTASEQGYAPPTIIEAGGKRQLILLHPEAVVSVDPETGKEYWSVDYEASNGSVIMTPIHSGDLLYAAGYSNKNILIKLNDQRPEAEVVWRDEVKAAISPVNVQPFLEDGVMYGFDQNGNFLGVELKSGARLWESTEPLDPDRRLRTGTAFIVKNGKRFWMFTERGDLVIANLSPDGFEEIDRAHVIAPTDVAFGRRVVWAAPAWANRRAYLRNGKECICVDLAQTPTTRD